MIVVEHILRDIFAQIPEIRIDDNLSVTPKFGWGDKKELDRYLLKMGNKWFPLIWLLPNTDKHTERGQRVERTCNIVICTLEERLYLYNDQRYLLSYDTVLNPLTNYVIQGLENSSVTTLRDGEEIFKHPNYSDTEAKKKSATIELIDAVRIDCDVEFNNNCLKTIKWITR